MPVDRFGEPWPGATYHGFSGAPHGNAPPTTPRTLRRPTRAVVLGGLAAAAALGLAAALMLRPDHRALSSDDQAEAQVAQKMPIQVDRPAPPPALPKPAGKLEVLNPATAEAARAAQPAWAGSPAAAPREAAAPAPSTPAPSSASTFDAGSAAGRLAQAAPPRPVVITPDAPPAVDRCAGARSRGEALVCADPDLAAYDRDLNRAFRRAMRSGAVSPDDLRADQRDWLADRERAAGRSPQALPELYQERIDELNRIADAGPGDDGY